MKKLVAISSVIEREESFKEYRYITKLAAESLGYNVRLNNEDAGASQTQFYKCIDEEKPVFIVLLGEVHSDVVKKECQRAVKKNLHIIPFFKVTKDDQNKNKIPQSARDLLNEVSPPIYSGDCMTFCDGAELYAHVKNALSQLESKVLTPAVLNRGHGKIYEHAGKMLEDVKHEYILCQKSSTLILGPNKTRYDEEEYYEQLLSWFMNSSKKFNNQHIKFTHIFSLERTRMVIESGNPYYDIPKAKENLMKLLPYLSNCLFIDTDWQNNSHPFVISDGDMLIDLYFAGGHCNVKLHKDLIDYRSFADMHGDIGSGGNILLNIGNGITPETEKFFEELYSKK